MNMLKQVSRVLSTRFISCAATSMLMIGCQAGSPLETVQVPQRLNPVSYPGTTSYRSQPHAPIDPSDYRGELSLSYAQAKIPVTRKSNSSQRRVASRYKSPKASAGKKMLALSRRKSVRKAVKSSNQPTVVAQQVSPKPVIADPFETTVSLRRVQQSDLMGGTENQPRPYNGEKSRQIVQRLDRVQEKLNRLSDFQAAYKHSPQQHVSHPGTLSQQELQDLAQQHNSQEHGYFTVTPANFQSMNEATTFESDIKIADWPHRQ